MSTLTKKLHILKTGETEETCNIYTTPEEVGGSPYLALEVDGQKGYVKLGSTTDANATHLRVKKNGTTYAAWKLATVEVPTGEKLISMSATFTVPSGITVLEIEYDTEVSGNEYVGVTPGSTHKITIESEEGTDSSPYYVHAYCDTHREYWGSFEWIDEPYLGVPNDSVIIRWSPEINKKSPTRTDYN